MERTSRKRTRNPEKHKRFISKNKVEKGTEHVSRHGKKINAKVFKSQVVCKCKRMCSNKIDVLRQKEIFEHYYQQCNWTTKTLYIQGCVTKKPVNKKDALNPILPKKNRDWAYEYKLTDGNGMKQVVCKNFFENCLQISPCRIFRAERSRIVNPPAKDHRGQGPPKNKSSPADKQFLNEYIDRFPKYRSHYSRSDSSRYYLASNLNVIKMYREYKIVCDFQERNVLSVNVFRTLFNTEHNLAFKRPKSDSCKTCDEFKVLLGLHDTNYLVYEEQHNKHLEAVESTKAEFRNDVEEYKKSNDEQQVIVFDLQKALETPSLTTSEAYYRRTLWTYDLCIYNETKDTGYFYVWSENIASRGADEIASCLVHYIKKYLPKETKRLKMYTDACGGQNRNIKLTLLVKKILLTHFCDNINIIEHKFFVSGHSRNSCDRCFGIIENQRKYTENIFEPKDWFNIISQAKKNEPKFNVIPMVQDDFICSKELLPLIVNIRNN